ncbi:retrotransposon protein, putative, ty1-copia subclass [Tanacetum coccineum]
MVLRVEKKLFVIEQPISLAPLADSKYLCSGIRFMMLIMRLLVLRSKEEGKPVGPYIIKIKNYVAQREGLGYVLPQNLSVGLILNGLTSDFVDFVRNYNKHNMRKTIGELHALLIEYENGLLSKGCYTTSNGDSRGVRKLKQVEAIGSFDIVLPNGLGCEELVKRDTPNKLQQRSVKCIFIGYPKETMGYYFNFPLENKIVVASEIPMEVEGFEPPQDTSPSKNTSEILMSKCRKMQSMKDNQVWCLVDLPPNGKIVRSKWIFNKKTNMDGNVHTYKARIVAKGFTQTYGVDYKETFLLVADIRDIRIIIAIVAFYDYEIWKMDVKTAFLNGYRDEDIYMVQPKGFVHPKHPRKVCKLQRSIYGLKQASRTDRVFDEKSKVTQTNPLFIFGFFGFAQNLDEPCVYQNASRSNVTFLILYVDDIIIMGNHIPSLQSVKTYLGKCFALKDLGEAAFILRSRSTEIGQSD